MMTFFGDEEVTGLFCLAVVELLQEFAQRDNIIIIPMEQPAEMLCILVVFILDSSEQ
jgi:hypothetical protein